MKTAYKVTIVFLALLLLMAAALYCIPAPDELRRTLSRIPFALAAPVFVLLYVAANFVVVDIKDPFKLAGAVVFGAWVSAVLIYIAETINAAIFFYLSRRLGQDFARRILKNSAQFYEKFSGLGGHWVFLLRALPIVPYRILDIIFGLSAMRFSRYMAAVALASFPRILFIQVPLAAVGSFSPAGFMLYWQDHPKVLLAGFIYFILTLLGVVALHFKLKKSRRPVVK